MSKPALDIALDELERVTKEWSDAHDRFERVIKEWRAAELVSKDFQMMLGRIVYRHGKGLLIDKQISQARDLILRKGTLSVLRDE